MLATGPTILHHLFFMAITPLRASLIPTTLVFFCPLYLSHLHLMPGFFGITEPRLHAIPPIAMTTMLMGVNTIPPSISIALFLPLHVLVPWNVLLLSLEWCC
jgi:hypothetical protein